MRWTSRGAWGALALAGMALGGIACASARRAPETLPPRSPAQALEDAPQDAALGVVHLVQPGQTLWRIARAYGTTVEALVKANGLRDPELIEVGQALFIPGAREVLDVPPYPAPVPPPGDVEARPDPGIADLLWPVPGGRVLSGYGAARGTHRHRGLDIGAPPGTPVRAAADGRVRYAGDTMRGYGKTVILEHGNGWVTLYAHNQVLLVRVGDRVRRGEIIARVGRTGNATGHHCHFELRRAGQPVDPAPYLGESVAGRLP